jgi:glutamate-1-semialdehyde aminotransferase
MDNTSQAEEERAASLELTLRDVLTQQGPLLQVASTTASLRYQFLEAVVYTLEATAAFLQQWERIKHALLRKSVVCQAFSLLSAYLGPGDAQVRGARGCAANLKGC